NATSVAQVATATQALVTATSVAQRVATGESALATAQQQQGIAQVEAATAETQVAFAGATLTAVATAAQGIEQRRDIASRLVNARLALNSGDNNNALDMGNSMVADYSTEPTAYVARGLIYRNLKRYDDAIADYSKAIELDPQHSYLYVNRGNVYTDL